MAWGCLIIAGLFEMTGVAMISKWHRDKSMLTLILLIAGFGLSFVFLALAMETLPMGMTYAIWTGIGTAGGAILGMMWYGEPKDWLRISCIGLIIVSAAGLKLFS
ncbi:QacE family quaternary ammonium compound efflux SMR transporter [Salibacterium salarium]|uniref:QacE family quaternary ammonium compound efflux SMR transporter n=1 Tax=Salibacterium salarium TaxID=284579 RepID=A0A3R9QFE5_9BACI|nr:multidrug efflux SMR transporter [Salibacterium salarium]RSL29387.1 QacE family quaternary ammonium compound efflux SMR transporter [Salibacterium salarium]